jgi:hypothetical protein
MRCFPSHDVRDFVTPVPENHFLGLASRSNFVIGPGYQGIENGQQPQALPGQPHEGSSPVSPNPQAAVSSETTQGAIVASSPLVSVAPSASQQVPLVEPAQSTSPPPSGSAQVSILPCPSLEYRMNRYRYQLPPL